MAEQAEEISNQMKGRLTKEHNKVEAPVMEEKPRRVLRAKATKNDVLEKIDSEKAEGYGKKTNAADKKAKRKAEEELLFVEESKRATTINEKEENHIMMKENGPNCDAKKAQIKAPKEEMNAPKLDSMNEDDRDKDEEWTPMDTVFQFTISIDRSRPRIFRKFQVPSTFTFEELHIAIQCCMGWRNIHLHEFKMRSPMTFKALRIGWVENGDEGEILPEDDLYIADYFTNKNNKAKYYYDFGDDWIHTITYNKILPKKKNTVYPMCVSGKLSCPPENVGGIHGYYEFLDIMKNPQHEEYEYMKDRWGREFDPNKFEPKDVKWWDGFFDDDDINIMQNR